MNDAPIQIGQLVIDLAQQRITREGAPIHLTKIEWAILRELAANPNLVQRHERLLKRVWGEAYNDETEYVHTYMRRLRRKLEIDPAIPTILVTESGIGYRFDLSRANGTPRSSYEPAANVRLINALPLDLGDRFVGREPELNLLRRLLSEHARVIGVYGRAGSGKTALVCAALREIIASESEQLTSIVSLNATNAAITLRRLMLDMRTLISVSDAEIDAAFIDAESPSQRAAALLSLLNGESILFLDGIEALQHPATGELLDDNLRAFIEAILLQGGGVRLLVTSRDPLMLSREVRALGRTISLHDGLSDGEGAELLRRADPDNVAHLRAAPASELHALSALAAGNPGALHAAAGLLIENPLLTPAQLIADAELFANEITFPYVERAFRRLDADALHVLEMAARFERPFTATALMALLANLPDNGFLARFVRGFYLRYDRETAAFALAPTDRAYLRARGSAASEPIPALMRTPPIDDL
ncbi:MAG: winged helix-turn-helix domain-containing protein [Chloroflexota bacterium]|nr:winged helix-turn-helix domain-containing protein [Chloroflexota bacterium]